MWVKTQYRKWYEIAIVMLKFRKCAQHHCDTRSLHARPVCQLIFHLLPLRRNWIVFHVFTPCFQGKISSHIQGLNYHCFAHQLFVLQENKCWKQREMYFLIRVSWRILCFGGGGVSAIRGGGSQWKMRVQWASLNKFFLLYFGGKWPIFFGGGNLTPKRASRTPCSWSQSDVTPGVLLYWENMNFYVDMTGFCICFALGCRWDLGAWHQCLLVYYIYLTHAEQQGRPCAHWLDLSLGLSCTLVGRG